MKKEFAKIKKLLQKSNSALLAAHADPDGDAIGSLLALGLVLNKLGLTTYLYCADKVPQIYRFLAGADQIKREPPPWQHFDVGFVVDSSDLARIGDKLKIRELVKTLINVDHHPDNALFGDINYVTKSSSVAEEVYDLARYLKVTIDKNIAEAIYAAIITDTGNFRYENTTVKTFLIAAELLKAGVNTHTITTLIYDNKSIPSIKVQAQALARIQFSPNKKIAWTSVTEEIMKATGAAGEDLIGIVDRLRSIAGVEVAVFFREKEGKVKVNFRAKDRINVSELAKRLGGGGHVKAAGAVIAGELPAVEERVIAEVTKQLQAATYLVTN